jgi:uncharacterized membrane protein
MTDDLPNHQPADGTSHPIVVEPQHHRSSGHIFLRGLAITLPSILTLVIVLWLGKLVYDYIVYPVSWVVRGIAANVVDDSRPRTELLRYDRLPPLDYVGRQYLLTKAKRSSLEQSRQEAVKAGNLRPDDPVPWEWVAGNDEQYDGVYHPLGNRAVPYLDYAQVAQTVPASRLPNTATGVYMELVTIRYFGSTFSLSTLAVVIALLAIYFVGRLVRIRLGAYLVSRIETDVLGRLPLISHVYGSVKQVTDFLFSERKVEYNRVVALEYPRRGIWSLGFVTGEGMWQTSNAAGEPLVNVLVPTSPMPVTGYTMSVPRSQVIDLDMSLDQACQFIISCGVLVPPQQISPDLNAAVIKREAERRIKAIAEPATAEP